MNTDVRWVRQNEVNDIFSYLDKNKKLHFEYFPRTMQMSIEDVIEYLN